MKYSYALRYTEGCRIMPLILEYLSPLLKLITPTIRPVDTLLMTNAEKREVSRIALLMACVRSIFLNRREYGVYYESTNTTGILQIELKPDLVAFATYPDLPSPFLKVTVLAACRHTVGPKRGEVQDAVRIAEGAHSRQLFPSLRIKGGHDYNETHSCNSCQAKAARFPIPVREREEATAGGCGSE